MPKITDPGEMDIIRKIYFEDHNFLNIDIEEIELNERMESKAKNSKNQAR